MTAAVERSKGRGDHTIIGGQACAAEGTALRRSMRRVVVTGPGVTRVHPQATLRTKGVVCDMKTRLRDPRTLPLRELGCILGAKTSTELKLASLFVFEKRLDLDSLTLV